MNEHWNLTSEERPLKFGETFTNPAAGSAFHTIKYDFKPASVDVHKPMSLEVGSSNQITALVPHIDASEVPYTLYKGSQQEYSKKHCVLIIDRKTGIVTIERLNSNIQLKKTRTESDEVVRLQNNTFQNNDSNTGSHETNPGRLPKHSSLQELPKVDLPLRSLNSPLNNTGFVNTAQMHPNSLQDGFPSRSLQSTGTLNTSSSSVSISSGDFESPSDSNNDDSDSNTRSDSMTVVKNHSSVKNKPYSYLSDSDSD